MKWSKEKRSEQEDKQKVEMGRWCKVERGRRERGA